MSVISSPSSSVTQTTTESPSTELKESNIVKDEYISDNKVPPADSLQGWLVILGSFFLLMISTGPTNSYGVYVQAYHTTVFPQASTTLLSWIGSLQFGCMCIFGVFSGILVERVGVRITNMVGSLVAGTALIFASICNSPVALLFTQGIMFGIGGSCILIPAMSLPGQWMDKYRAIAAGIVLTGGSLGGVWMSYATRAMVSNIGWRWSLRVTGIITIVVGFAVIPLMRSRILVEKRDKIIDFAALKQMRFVVLFFASLFAAGGYFIPYYYMPSFGKTAVGLSESWGSIISLMLNAGGIFGRIAAGLAANRIGSLNLMCISCMLSTLAVFVLWLPFKNIGVLVTSALVFGFSSASVMSLVPVVTANIFGIKRLPSIIGLLFSAYAIGTFTCPPVGGVLLDKYGHGTDYSSVIIYGGVYFALGTMLMGVLRAAQSRKIFCAI